MRSKMRLSLSLLTRVDGVPLAAASALTAPSRAWPTAVDAAAATERPNKAVSR
jgi:hypothetical protein